jgi:hypothetical protein
MRAKPWVSDLFVPRAFRRAVPAVLDRPDVLHQGNEEEDTGAKRKRRKKTRSVDPGVGKPGREAAPRPGDAIFTRRAPRALSSEKPNAKKF